MRIRYIYSLGSRLVGAVIQTAVLAFTARALGVDLFSHFALALSLAQVLLVVTELGFATRVLRVRMENQPGQLFGSLSVVRATSTIIVLGALFLLGIETGSPLLSVCVAVYATGEGLGDLAGAILQGELRAGRAALALVARRCIAAVPFLLVLTSVGGGLAVLLSLVSAGLLGHWIFWRSLSARWSHPRSIRRTLRENMPLFLTSSGTNLTQSDTLVVGATGGAAIVSSYAAASRLSNPINLAISTLIQVLVPELALHAPMYRRRAFRRARRWVVLAAAIVALSGLVFAEPIVQILYGREFAAAAPILRAVFVGAAISAWSQLHLSYLYVEGVRVIESLGVIFATILGVVLLSVATLYAGSIGAALGFVLMQLSISATITWLWSRRWRIRRRN